jgi:hypothetical protein
MGERERGREREREANNQSCSIKLEETGDLLFKKCTVYVKKGMLPNDEEAEFILFCWKMHGKTFRSMHCLLYAI